MISIDYNKDENNVWSSKGFVCGMEVPEMHNEHKVHKTAKRMDQREIMIRINHGDKPSEHYVVMTSNFFMFCQEEVHFKIIQSTVESNKKG